PPMPDARFRTRTDEGGWFHMEGLPSEPSFLLVEHPGWMTELDGPFDVPPGGGGPARWIELRAGAAISGRLLDAEGRPLAGEKVELVPIEPSSFASGSRQSGTDAEGRFRFEHLPAGLYLLCHRVEVGGFPGNALSLGVRLEEGERREVDLAPAGSGRLEGILEADGEVPAGISVNLNRPPVATGDAQARERALSGTRSMYSLDGRFTFSGLEAGDYVLSAMHRDLATRETWIGSAKVTVSEGRSNFVRLRLEKR
ncbi:MAG TPA: carboxypeptidase-like regulatory domain-containing protein, partial [Planctomycetota bacterium]|nr:carboxypeptidase-like regulatory domain-containing protein [Planctomycetota bacterium]